MKALYKNFFWFLLSFLLLALLFSFYNYPANETKPIDLGTLINQINNEEVAAITVADTKLTITLKNGTKEIAYKEATDSLSTLLKNYSLDPQKIQKVSVEIKNESGWTFWLTSVLPFVLPFLLIGVFIWLMTRQVQGANSRALM